MNNSRTYKLSPQAEENTEYSKSGVTAKDFKVLRKAVDGTNSSLQVLSNQIDLKVSNNDIINRINLSTEGILIQANRLTLSGLVTFTNLSTAGQTTINGSNITTGTLNASLITTGTLNADRIYGGTISGNIVGLTDLNASNITAGTLNADRINTNTLNVNKLQTGTSLGGAGLIAFNSSNITLYGSSINDASFNFNNSGNIVRIYNAGSNTIGISGALYLDGVLQMQNQITSRSIIPAINNTYALGTTSFRWASMWQTSGAVTGSDKVLKKNIEEIDEAVEFIRALRPVRYVMKDGYSGRTHYGFIAQEVKQALDKIGKDRALYIDPVVKEVPENGAGYAKGLRYDEFIAPAISAIQQLLSRVEVLENELHSRTL